MKLAKMKVVEMRRELDARGLNTAGTRPTLMKRLREALNREEEEKALQQRADQPPKVEQSHHSAEDQLRSEGDDPETAEARSPIARSPKDAPHLEAQRNGSPREQVTAAQKEHASTATQLAPTVQADKSVTSGSINYSSELSMDERMQKRLQRFGTVSSAPDKTDDAIQKRRKRFGAVEKRQEEKPAKRRRPSNEVDEQVLKEHEEAKKRRAAKFGISFNAGKEPTPPNTISADEMEKRLRRQRRFQQVGS